MVRLKLGNFENFDNFKILTDPWLTDGEHLGSWFHYPKFDFKSHQKELNSYDAIYIDFKLGDKNFIIHSISGIIDFSNSIKKCKRKKDEIVEEIKSIFTKPIIEKDTVSHDEDKTGKSKVYRTSFAIVPSSKYLPIDIACFDWTKKMGYADHLRIGIKTNEYNDWLHNEAYK